MYFHARKLVQGAATSVPVQADYLMCFFCFQLLSHPVHTLKLIKRDVLRTVEKRSSKWLWSTFTTKQLYWLLAVYFLPMMTLQVIVSSVSTALFTGAIAFMVLITMQIAINSEKLQTQIEYLSLFQFFNKEGTQIQPHLRKSDVIHYVTFLVGLAVAIVTLGLSNHSFIYYEALVIVCVVVSFLIVMEFDLYESPLFYFFALAKMPSWVMVGIEKFCSLVSIPVPSYMMWFRTPQWTLLSFYGCSFEISPLTIVQVGVHIFLIATQLRGMSWKRFLSELGPLLLFLCWFVLTRYFIVQSSAYHLFLMSVGILAFPLTTFSFLVSPFLFWYWYGFFTAPFYYSVAAVVISAIFSAFVIFSYKHKRSWWMSLSLEYVVLGVFVILLGLVLFLSAWYASVFQVSTPLPTVSWQEYTDYCGPQKGDGKNIVQTQINCMHLQGRVVSASGEVRSVKISEAVDNRANSLKLFPYFLQRAITCHLGQYDPMCGDRTDMSTCVYNGCHFQHDLMYTFKIELNIPYKRISYKASLLVSHHHKEFVMKLTEYMVLDFNATFVEGMGSDSLVLRAIFLDAEGLDDTQSLEKEREEEIHAGMLSTFLQSVKNSIAIVLEIFFGYVVQYK